MNHVPVDKIIVGERARQDLGDLTGLVESIRKIGLLHPIVVTESYELVAGGRRLEAIRQLGHKSIAATILPMSPEQMLYAERDENTARLDLRRSEMVALGRQLETVLKEKVRDQQRESGRRLGTGQQVGETPSSCVGPVRERVAGTLGVGSSTYEKAKQVVEAAEADPEQYGDLVETMDETGNVYGTHRELKERQQGSPPKGKNGRPMATRRLGQIAQMAAEGYSAGQIAEHLGVQREYVMQLAKDNNIELVEHRIGKKKRIDYDHVVEQIVASMESNADAVELVSGHLQQLTPEDVNRWIESLKGSVRAVRQLIKRLQETAE